MKPNLINIKTLENELKQIQINKDNFISLLFNLFLVVVMTRGNHDILCISG